VTTTLSFRKESIQQSSRESEALSRQVLERTDATSPKHAREQRPITITTSLTTI
jgi:hypothetical protein